MIMKVNVGINVSDTIVCDSSLLKKIINDGNYDYNSEITVEQKSLLEKVKDDFGRWLDDVLSSLFNSPDAIINSNNLMRWVWIGIAAVALVTILYYIYKKKMFFFKKKEKAADDYEVGEETIYGIDFDKEIAAAVGRGDYREAVRLRYLQCLKFLSDHEVIDWRIYKTPAQYTREYKQAAFTQLTRTYVLVRYGDRDANQSVLDGIVGNYESIVERVEDSKVAAAGQEEGGPA